MIAYKLTWETSSPSIVILLHLSVDGINTLIPILLSTDPKIFLNALAFPIQHLQLLVQLSKQSLNFYILSFTSQNEIPD